LQVSAELKEVSF